MTERAHLSIGEVLNLLQDEFPDITISKIRFLESQGLLDPERTPSGYRKFYDDDIARLRWILQQQREHFLPLKVIKDRLAGTAPDDPGNGSAAGDAAGAGHNGHGSHPDAGTIDADITLHGVPSPLHEPTPGAPRDTGAPPGSPEEDRAGGTASSSPAESEPESSNQAKADSPVTTPHQPPSHAGIERSSADAIFSSSDTAMSLNVEELARATGLTARQIGELERFGLIEGEQFGSATRYDEEALLIARVAASMLREGVEVRHLRMFKLAAEREAAFYEQLVVPIMKQRSPQARQEALETLRVLAAGGDALRTSMLRSALKHLVSRG